MESKYQVVSIKENPFQRAGDVTFRGPSPSFTITDFSVFCSFLSPPLPHFFFLLSFFSVLGSSGKRILSFLEVGSEFLLWTRPHLSRGSEPGSSRDHPLALSSGACQTTLTDVSGQTGAGLGREQGR